MLAEQKVAAEKAQAEANRVEGLDNKGVLYQEANEQRRLAANSANVAVAAAQAQLNDLLVRQRRLVISAPRSGSSEARRVGNEFVSPCISSVSPSIYTQKYTLISTL